MPDPPPSLYPRHPTVLVDRIEKPALTAGLTWLAITRSVEGGDVAEARFVNWGPREGQTGFLYSDRTLLDFGKELKLTIGPPDRAVQFEGRITALEGVYPKGAPPELGVRVEDRLALLAGEPRTRVFHDQSDADILQGIASSHGLTLEMDALGMANRVLAQTSEDDLTFLRRRARELDADVILSGITLRFRSRSTRSAAPLQLRYGTELDEFRARADLVEQCSTVVATGWDVGGKQALSEEARAPSLGPDAAGGLHGGGLRQRAMGERKVVVPAGASNAADARRAAANEYRRRGRRFLTGVGVAWGAPDVRCGEEVKLAGLGPTFDGVYRVVRVRITFDLQNGLRTEFEVESPVIGRGPSGGNPNADRDRGLGDIPGGRVTPSRRRERGRPG